MMATNMTERVHHHPNLIYSPGTQVVTLVEVLGQRGKVLQPRGSVGVVIHSPADLDHPYRVRFADGVEESLNRDQVTMLARFKESEIGNTAMTTLRCNLYERVIYRCVIGSQAYGLAGEGSDIDRRGIYLPRADLHWSLYSVPDQLENDETQEAYWEVQKFLVLALKANPNVLECLYTPMVEKATPLAEKLLAMRSIFLSRMVYQTYNGYVLSQFKKMQADIRNKGQVKWKHVMHLIRLLLSGIRIMREGFVVVRVEEHREKLLAIRRGELPWEEVENWRKRLHREFNAASETTNLPERPDYEMANAFLIEARRSALSENLP
ncbi:MAG: DNA polymerase beta superfamily protein [Gemmataceae bacterium]